MTFAHDSSFSEEALCGRYNADLANDLGNLFSRVLSMTHKYFGGSIPEPAPYSPDDEELKTLAREACQNFQCLFERFQTSKALEALWTLVRGLNKYIDVQAPWTLFKENNTSRLTTAMYCVLEGMYKAAAHLLPVMPDTADTMLKQLGVSDADVSSLKLTTDAATWGQLKPGTPVAQSSNLFPRMELPVGDAPATAKPQKIKEETKISSNTEKPTEAKAPVDFADFQKIDLRVATVLEASPVPKADKLLLVKLDLGEPEPRQVVAGIAEHWTPQQLIGRQVIVVANLKPRKLRGVESQGMILAVKRDGGLELVAPSASVTPGSPVS
jgi:methionyl-tRNA synthetase